MGQTILRVCLASLVVGMCFSVARAQEKPADQQQETASQKPQDTRIDSPAAPLSPLSAKEASSYAQMTDQAQPACYTQNGLPLSGVEQFTLRTMGCSHTYFHSLFQTAESVDTNAKNQLGSSGLESISTIDGAFTVSNVWSRYSLVLNYAGVGLIDNLDPSLDTSAHSLSILQKVKGRRSSLLVADTASYLPEASFGYARFGGFNSFSGFGGLSGVNISGLNGMYSIPNQSILTGNSSRISNTAVGQYNYNLSPLSSVTFIGAYGLLRFPYSGFIDSSTGIFELGYNHAIGRRNSVGINYTGSLYRYNNDAAFDFMNHIVQVMYRHQISNLLSLQLGGGPQINMFGNASAGRTDLSWYANAQLDYRLSRTQLSLRYRHYTSAGAGVYSGAETDRLELDVGRQITRMWSGGLGLGYSYNKNLQEASASPTFNTWYASANLQRTLGPYMSMFLSYNLQQQVSSIAFCIDGSCGSFYTRNYFSLGLSWHPRSVELGGLD